MYFKSFLREVAIIGGSMLGFMLIAGSIFLAFHDMGSVDGGLTTDRWLCILAGVVLIILAYFLATGEE